MIDGDGRVVFLSRKAGRLFGTDRARGRPWREVLRLDGEQEAVFEALLSGGPSSAPRPRLHLIDQAGRIRAVYEGLDPGTKKRVLADVRRLMAEDAGV